MSNNDLNGDIMNTELNNKKLQMAQTSFLAQYPQGFEDPEMVKIGKKHRVAQMTAFTQESFAKAQFKDSAAICENMIKAVSRSSMVSMFEKPKFKGFVNRLNNDEKSYLASCLKDLLHGKQERGFTGFVDILRTEKIAKWSLVSIIPAYYSPTTEVFVKPTTAKDVIKNFEVADLVYKPAPTWEFYQSYRQLINKAKTTVSPTLSPSNAAFSGFLMMAMKMQGFDSMD